MSRPGHLAQQLAADAASGLQLRIGVIRTWNTTTGAGTVDISGDGAGGATITNPMSIGTPAGYAAGNPVALIGTAGRWLILGRLTIPPP